jgi:hypothetical protein
MLFGTRFALQKAGIAPGLEMSQIVAHGDVRKGA